MPYPWQLKQWQQLQDAVSRQRLPHALLLTGANGTGINPFALQLAHSLLCEERREGAPACGQCRSCVLLYAGSHPDIRQIYPEEPGRQIKVENIRELIRFFHLSTQYGKHKIAIIAPAEAMNRSAANGLLKTLEEPPALSLLILVSYQQAKLPITIRSRCQKIQFNEPEHAAAFAWLNERLDAPEKTTELLALTDNAPLKAFDLSEADALEKRQAVMRDLRELRMFKANPVHIAEKWLEFDMTEVLRWLLAIFGKMARTGSAPSAEILHNSRINKELHHLSNGLHLHQIISCYDLVLKNYGLITGTTNLNKQGLLEEIIIHWQFLRNNRGSTA